jgi:Dolichyl-phosphate-mannose-protein mannosyltransferase
MIQEGLNRNPLESSSHAQSLVMDMDPKTAERTGVDPRWKKWVDYFNSNKLPYFRILLICAILLSAISLWFFLTDDFYIAHFDAKGHQMVPRRIFDNLSPGWIQIGAFWLPLPHILYYPFVKIDWLYFHGLAGTPISMICFVLTVLLIYKLIEKVIGPFPAFCGSALYLTNPNMLYLQTTALTENLSILFMVASVYLFVLFTGNKNRKYLAACSFLSALGVLCRYENWFCFGLIGILLIVINIKEKRGLKNLLIDGAIMASFNVAAIALSFFINWYTTGHVHINIENKKTTDFQPGKDSFFVSIFVELYTLGNLISYDAVVFAILGFVLLFRQRFRDSTFLAYLAIIGPFLMYLYAYHDNLPTRIRYGLSFVPAAVCFLAYWPSRSRLARYLFLVYAVYLALFSPYRTRLYTSQLLDESLRDAENLAIQQDLLWYLKQHDDGQLILVAMSDIAPVVYDLKLPIKRFIHEGSKPWWNDAYTYGHPEKVAGWVFLNQGDRLWQKFHADPEFHKHFALIGRRKFLELYRRTPDEKSNTESHKAHPNTDKFTMPNLPGI